jgi:hypothetical protein
MVQEISSDLAKIRDSVYAHDQAWRIPGGLSLNPASPRWLGRFEFKGNERKDGVLLSQFQHKLTRRSLWLKLPIRKE